MTGPKNCSETAVSSRNLRCRKENHSCQSKVKHAVHKLMHAHTCIMYIKIPVVRARGGAEVALGSYYKAFLIYRTCMRRTPARPVRACFVRSCCKVVVQEHDQRGTPAQCNEKRTLSSHFTLRSSHLALHTSHMHFTLHTSSHLKSCELFSHHLTSSQLFSSRPISSHMSSK